MFKPRTTLPVGLDMGRVGLGFGLSQPTHMGFGSAQIATQPSPNLAQPKTRGLNPTQVRFIADNK